MLDRCKAIAKRAGLDPAKFDLKTFRSTYATRMLRQGFDVRTVQHWMGHKSLETTMRYLVPATDVHGRLDLVKIPTVAKTSPDLLVYGQNIGHRPPTDASNSCADTRCPDFTRALSRFAEPDRR